MQLPLFNEATVTARLLDHVAAIELVEAFAAQSLAVRTALTWSATCRS